MRKRKKRKERECVPSVTASETRPPYAILAMPRATNTWFMRDFKKI
jgi:hypothetical protein